MVQMENYSNNIKLEATAEKVFIALTHEIAAWWTEMFEGAANVQGETFTVRFGDKVFKTMKVSELVKNAKVVWEVEQSLIEIPELKNQSEWVGTTIIWVIKQDEGTATLHLEHVGLNKGVECYDICSAGWQQFIDSLKCYLETGKGNPFKNMS